MDTGVRAKLLGLLCVIAAGGMLTLGLFPFHAPLNKAKWDPDGHGIHLQGYSWLMGSANFTSGARSLEIRLQPDPPTDDGDILWFSTAEDPLRFGIRQAHDGLVLETPRREQLGRWGKSMYVDNVFREQAPTVIAVSTNAASTQVYINGSLRGESKEFLLSPEHFTGRLVLGTSPLVHDVWSGKLMGLAIFRKPLTADEISRHYRSWTATGEPEASGNPDITDLYLFREGAGRIVRDHASPGIDLEVPKRFRLIHQVFLQRPWNEFHPNWSYVMEVLKNIVGFVPFGFLARAYLTTLGKDRWSFLVTTALGAAISLTIEVLQALLPTRDSGMTDLMTNTFGTWIGCMLLEIKYLREFLGETPAAGKTEELSRS